MYGLIGAPKGESDQQNPITLDVRRISVECQVCNVLTSVCSTLEYENHTDSLLECMFVFPLDEMAVVYHFQAEIDGRVIVAEVQERQEARETYERAMEMQQTAFLLEEDERAGDTFRISLGNVSAHSTVRVSVKYVQQLKLEEASTPISESIVDKPQILNLTLPCVLNPRYDPNPNGASFKKGILLNSCPYAFSFVAHIRGSMRIERVEGGKDTFEVKFHNEAHTEVKASLERDAASAPKDHDLQLQLVYTAQTSPHIVYERGSSNGTSAQSPLAQTDVVLLNFVPDLKTQAPGSEFVFLVDRSGSMSGSRIMKAQEALLLLLKSLPTGCYFQIIGFGSSFNSVFPVPTVYNEGSLKTALDYQRNLNADLGGTEILAPLQSVYSQSIRAGFARSVFLITDGDVGNSSEVVALVAKHRHNTTVYAVGIGEGVSTALINGVVRAGGGRAEFLRDSDTNFSGKILGLLKAARQARVSEVQIETRMPSGVCALVIPRQLDTLFHGQLLTVFVLLKGDLSQLERDANVASATLKGRVGSREVAFPLAIQRPTSVANADDDLLVHRLAAKRQILEFTDEAENVDKDRVAEIVALSKAFNLVSRHTSFVGVDRESHAWEARLLISGVGSSEPPEPPQPTCLDPCLSEQFIMGSTRVRAKKGGLINFSLPKISNPFSRSKSNASSSKKSFTNIFKREHSIPSSEETCSYSVGDAAMSSVAVLRLAALQNFDGSWKSAPEVWNILSDDKKRALAEKPGDWTEESFVTLLVVVFLSVRCQDKKDEWLLFVEKAFNWLHGKKDAAAVDGLKNVLEQKAKSLLK